MRSVMASAALLGTPFRHARRQGQNRLLAIQRLDLRIFVDEQHNCPIGG